MTFHEEKFLFFQAKPYKAWWGIPLSKTVLFIAIIDFCAGMINLYRFSMQCGCMYQGEKSLLDLLFAVSFMIGTLSLIFAFNAIKAILVLKYRSLRLYAFYKEFEFVSQLLISVLYEFISYMLLGIVSYPTMVYILFTRIFLYYVAKIV
jgi:hypothetical protein